MPENEKAEALRLGFLSAIEIPDRGHMGGLLVTNRYGRPLEFQCTSPVQANRMQEILYGHTLSTFILSELIGKTLLDKVGVKPQLVLIEDGNLLDLREHVSVPVALVVAGPNAQSGQYDDTSEPADDSPAPAPCESVRLGKRTLRVHSSHAGDRDAIAAAMPAITADADLGEPFERVRKALNETIRSGTLR